MKDVIINNTLITGLSQAIIAVIGFLLLPFMLQNLGVIEYGLIGFAKSFSVLGPIAVFEFGLKVATTKYVAQYKAENNVDQMLLTISTAMVILLVVGIIIAVVGNIFTNQIAFYLDIPESFRESFSVALSVVFVSYIFEMPGFIAVGALEGIQRFDLIKRLDVIYHLMNAFASVVLVLSGFGFLEVITVFFGLSALKNILYFKYVYDEVVGQGFKFVFSNRSLSNLYDVSKYLVSTRVSSILSLNGEKLLIAFFLTPAHMSAYEVLVKLPRFLKSSLALGGGAVLPAASALSAVNDVGRNEKLFVHGLRLNVMLVFPVVLCAIYFSHSFIRLWVGDDFVYLATMLQFLLVVNLFIPFGSFGWNLMVGMNDKIYAMSYISWVNTVLRLGLVVLLMPWFDLWAVVIGSLSYVFTVPASVYLHINRFNASLWGLLRSGVVAALVSCVPLSILYLVSSYFVLSDLFVLILVGFVCLVASILLFYYFVMNKFERSIVDTVVCLLVKKADKLFKVKG